MVKNYFLVCDPALPGLWFQTKDNDSIIFGLEPKDLIDKTPFPGSLMQLSDLASQGRAHVS
jgi:hypothetical protein